MPINPTWANKLLDHLFMNGAMTQPTNIYVSAHTGDPGTTGANEHGATAGYARIATSGSDWDDAASGALDNAAELAFPQATADYSADITHFGLWDTASGGTAANFIGGGALSASKTVQSGDTLKFEAGDLDASIT